eukprot:403349501
MPDQHRSMRFKLQNLTNQNLRYEVIYKNILRDMRKYYLKDFNQFSNYNKKKKKLQPKEYQKLIRDYIVSNQILESEPIHGAYIGTSIDKLTFYLGSLIYPKSMIKSLNPFSEEQLSKNLRKDATLNPPICKDVIRIYHYLYRFSLQRLARLVKNPSMTKLFWNYYQKEGPQRITRSKTLRKYVIAYYEAAEKLCNSEYYVDLAKQQSSGKIIMCGTSVNKILKQKESIQQLFNSEKYKPSRNDSTFATMPEKTDISLKQNLSKISKTRLLEQKNEKEKWSKTINDSQMKSKQIFAIEKVLNRNINTSELINTQTQY